MANPSSAHVPGEITLDATELVKLEHGTDIDPRRPFSMVAYSGAAFDAGFGSAVIDLEGLSTGQEIPIFRQHDPTLYVGRSTSVTLAGGQIAVIGRLFDGIDAADEVAALSDQGAQWQASVGIRIDTQAVEFLDDGETLELNGHNVDGPVLVLRKTRLKESSFVPLGADGRTSAVALSDLKKKGVGMADTNPLKTERERVAALHAEFANDPEFALSAIISEASMVEAKAQYADRMRVELAAQQEAASAALAEQLKTSAAEIAQLKADLAQAQKPNPAAALTTIPAGAPEGDPGESWDALLAAEIQRLSTAGASGFRAHGLNLPGMCNIRAQAAHNVASQNPELHTAYLAGVNGRS